MSLRVKKFDERECDALIGLISSEFDEREDEGLMVYLPGFMVRITDDGDFWRRALPDGGPLGEWEKLVPESKENRC